MHRVRHRRRTGQQATGAAPGLRPDTRVGPPRTKDDERPIEYYFGHGDIRRTMRARPNALAPHLLLLGLKPRGQGRRLPAERAALAETLLGPGRPG